ncbi:hypothetical protein [Paenibacillus abyssi]|uniref:hypothetical protein n=1 Tax=Paenibacillus abyssi TaxID=1340531 RepID=UPI00166743E5|nr:hypothetical protein [Paenibacillus abyssi]
MYSKWLVIPLLLLITIGACTHYSTSGSMSMEQSEAVSVRQDVYPSSVVEEVYSRAVSTPLERSDSQRHRELPDFNP